MKKFLDRLKDKGYKISGSKAFLLGVEFTSKERNVIKWKIKRMLLS